MVADTDDPGPRAPLVAALEEIRPYLAAAGAVALLGTPAEVVVPITRRLRGRSGVSVGPGLVNLVNGAVALAVTHRIRRDPAPERRWKERPVPLWAWLAGLAYLTLSPAAAGTAERGVVLRRRSPLWGALLSPQGLLQAGLVAIALVRARRAAGGTPAAGDAAPGADAATGPSA